MENRSGLVIEACLTHADGHAERNAALAMIEPRADRPARVTLGADKGYDVQDFVNELRSMNVTPHVAAKSKGSAIDGRTTRHAGYAVSQRIRKRIEEPFGWSKTVGLEAKTMLRGLERVGGQFILNLAAASMITANFCLTTRQQVSRAGRPRVLGALASLSGSIGAVLHCRDELDRRNSGSPMRALA